jgi:hypothetical protein
MKKFMLMVIFIQSVAVGFTQTNVMEDIISLLGDQSQNWSGFTFQPSLYSSSLYLTNDNFQGYRIILDDEFNSSDPTNIVRVRIISEFDTIDEANTWLMPFYEFARNDNWIQVSSPSEGMDVYQRDDIFLVIEYPYYAYFANNRPLAQVSFATSLRDFLPP